jgi:hypothetical protein
LFGEFTFGFELEGYYRIQGHRPDDEHRWFNTPTENEVHPKRQENYKRVESIISQYLPIKGSKFVKDESLREKLGYFDFEWASPVLNFTPQTISQVIKFLSAMPDLGIKTTSDCGFHVHVSFPYMNNLDRVWLICNLAIDPVMRKKLEKFKRFKFLHDDYAGTMILDQLSSVILSPVTEQNVIDEKDKPELFVGVKNAISDEKFELVRLHPQGTLEWRGPRNFLNKPDQMVIREFFVILREFIQWIKVTMEKKEIVGIDKKEFLAGVGSARLKKPITQSKLVSIFDKLQKNPNLLNKIHDIDLICNLRDNREVGGPKFFNLFADVKLTPETQMFYAKNELAGVLLDNINVLDEEVLKYLIDNRPQTVVINIGEIFRHKKQNRIKPTILSIIYDGICSAIQKGNYDLIIIVHNCWFGFPSPILKFLKKPKIWKNIPDSYKDLI